MSDHFRSRATAASFSPTLFAASERWRSPPCCSRTSCARQRSIRWRLSRRTCRRKAKSVIFLFMAGGPSHMDTFDPKPLLNKLNGAKAAGRVRRSEVSVRQQRIARCSAPSARSNATARAASKSPTCFRISPSASTIIAVIRSCHGDMVVHSAAQYQLFTGRVIPGFPSMGSWVIYGLGSEADSLPAYVVMPDPKGALEAGAADVHQRIPAGGVSAHHFPSRDQARC